MLRTTATLRPWGSTRKTPLGAGRHTCELWLAPALQSVSRLAITQPEEGLRGVGPSVLQLSLSDSTAGFQSPRRVLWAQTHISSVLPGDQREVWKQCLLLRGI